MKKIGFILLLIHILLIYDLNSTPNRSVIGYTVSKLPISLYKFGYGKDLLLIVAGIHGNEENTVKTANILIDKVSLGEIVVPSHKSLWVIPSLNPDGLARGRRVNNNNVDLNRNFLTKKWQSSYFFFNTKLSAGENPFSELETIAIKNLLEEIKNEFNIVVLSLHSSGNTVLPGGDEGYNKSLLKIVMKNSSYSYDGIGYDTFGDLTRWLEEKHSISSITIEFKSKKESDYNNIKKIVRALLKIDFLESIYKNKLKLPSLFQNSDTPNLEWLLDGLPKSVQNNIKSSEKSKKLFLEYLAMLKDKDELLLWVNKTNKLSSEYVPDDLVVLDTSFSSSKSGLQLRSVVLSDLKAMFESASTQGATLNIISSYRSYKTQKIVFDGWVKKFGEKEARRVSAEPGSSQHQLGTAIDFNNLDENFDKTKEGIWLAQNSHKFGFIISFPKGDEEYTGFKYEPWHYRYVGKEASFLIYNYFNNSLELFLSWYWSKKEDK